MGNPVDLVEFLGGMELGQYAQVLMDNEIDLEAVQLMADSDFLDIGRCPAGYGSPPRELFLVDGFNFFFTERKDYERPISLADASVLFWVVVHMAG